MPVEAGFSNCNTNITAQADLSLITVIGRCSWTIFGYQDNNIRIRGEMTVTPSQQKTYCAKWGYCGMSLKPPYEASTRYTSTAKFEAWEQDLVFLEETTVTDSETTPDATNPHTTCPGCCEYSPILISERGDYALTSLDDGVTFDIDADGRPERVSWTAPDSEVAFLARDRNGNGLIDSGAELFGDTAAVNGWEALATLDRNGDGVVSSSDPEWRQLLLWYDRNHDGVSTPAELLPVHASGIVAIGISYRWLGRRDAFGNMFRYAGEITFRAGRRQAYDVYFVGY
ncbi:MAG TPA: hypothetical protein VNA69_18955 [Thermoanaerobaculia bacterium]|nr:hypothetical protein [Thermoanaerobaculia bacterium]